MIDLNSGFIHYFNFFFFVQSGMPAALRPRFITDMLARLELTEFSDVVSGSYSGGNKRKLSVGVALIGNPPVVFLDEPSTGMDPAARRSMWNLISETMAGRSVMLTTHSMEECEALCSRIGIMVNGGLVCLGSSQHLKSRFGRGFVLQV
jgi:ABC-type multidrug transport system ATPase subunit